MRTFLRGKVTLLFLTLAVLLAVPAVAALADNLQDDLTTSAQAKSIATGNANAWTDHYTVQATGSGTDIGPGNCDIPSDGSATFKLNGTSGLTVSSPDGTTADGSPKLVFTACDTPKAVTFSSNNTGTYNITASYVSGTGGVTDGFNVTSATLNLTVVAAPTVTATLPANDAAGVAVTDDVTATFDQGMNATTINASNFKLIKDGDATNTALPAAVSYNATSKVATLNPTNNLDPGTKYNVVVVSGGVKTPEVTQSGGQVVSGGYTLEQDKTWSFTTLASCTNPADPVFQNTPNANGWFTSIPTPNATSSTSTATVKYSTSENGTYSTTPPTLGQGETTVWAKAFSSTGTCSSAAVSKLFKVDTIAPSITDDGTTQTPNGAGWFNTAVSNSFSASDATSGLPASFTTPFSVSSGTDQGSAVKIKSGPVSDVAGNTNPGIDSDAFMIDLTPPSVTVTGVSNGGAYTLGTVPTPGCDTTDALSGVQTNATVNVTGGNDGIGTLTATCSGAVDNADNDQDAPVSATYKVNATFNGWLPPVDGSGGANTINVGKAGRTYPIKWQLLDGGTPISDATAQLLVGTMTGGQAKVACGTIVGDSDQLEDYTTGSTVLRYDALSDQFIYNYKAPTTTGCYTFAIKNADGVNVKQANFNFTK